MTETIDQHANRIRTSVKTIHDYNDEFSHDLTSVISRAIMTASMCNDAPIIAMRNKETLDALIRTMIMILATSEFFDTSSNLRKFANELKRDILKRVPKAKQENKDIIGGLRSGYPANMRTDGNA
jgi:hypothetical protein